jgi:hypothetical protein
MAQIRKQVWCRQKNKRCEFAIESAIGTECRYNGVYGCFQDEQIE